MWPDRDIYHSMIYRKKTRRAAPTTRFVAQTLDRAQYEALAEFRYALRAFLAFSEAATRSAGITAQQYQALLAIKASSTDSLLVGELACELLIKHNAAVQLADRLVTSGLVARAPSQSDRRAVELRLTAKGNRCIGSLAAIHYSELMHCFSDLSVFVCLGWRLGTM